MRKLMLGLLLWGGSLAAWAQQGQELPSLKTHFEQHHLQGSFLMLHQGQYQGYNLPRSAQGFLPASTFKIPNTLIGLESGAVTPATVFRWNGKSQYLPLWEKDLTLPQAFQASCVPAYQTIARLAGYARMRELLGRLQYGHMDVRPDNLENFWLEGDSKITAYEQVQFLQRLQEETLPVSAASMRALKEMMVIERGDGYVLRGKTGWTGAPDQIGWFVGYLEKDGKVYYFATNAQPADSLGLEQIVPARVPITRAILRELVGKP